MAKILSYFLISSLVLLSIAALMESISFVDHRFDMINHFRPVTLLACFVTLVLCLFVRWRPIGRTAVILSGSLCLWNAWVVVPEVMARFATGTDPSSSDKVITLATINVYSGEYDPDRLERLIAGQRPDIIAFQELTPTALRKLPLAVLDGFPFQMLEGNVAIFSRHRITPVAVQPSVYDQRRRLMSRPPVLVARIEPEGINAITVVATHLAYPLDPASQEVQFPEFPTLIQAYLNGRSVLIGDMNTTPWANALRRFDAELPLLRITRALPSWPALPFAGISMPFPIMPIDHIFIGGELRAVAVQRGAAFGSDHYPLFARIAVMGQNDRAR